jgi:uncharacterized protein involved in type VI secretion and phage assembly
MNFTARDAAPRFPGLYVARVEALETTDTTEKLGRIQVSIPSIFEASDPTAFAWARPCMPFAHFFVPDVGDYVWVAFENGDPSAPVWLGIWYPDGKVPSQADVWPPLKRVIRSTSGHVIVMDDTEGSEALTITDKFGNSIEMRENAVLIKCVADLTIDASGKNVVIKASSVDVQES